MATQFELALIAHDLLVEHLSTDIEFLTVAESDEAGDLTEDEQTQVYNYMSAALNRATFPPIEPNAETDE